MVRIKKIRSLRRKNIRFVTDLDLIKRLNRSNNKDCSLRAHYFLSYHLIKLPWVYKVFHYITGTYTKVYSVIKVRT